MFHQLIYDDAFVVSSCCNTRFGMFDLGHFKCCKLAIDDFSCYKRLFEMLQRTICNVAMGDLIQSSFFLPVDVALVSLQMLHLQFMNVAMRYWIILMDVA